MSNQPWSRLLRVVPVGFLVLVTACASQHPASPVVPAAARPAAAPQRYDVIVVGAGMAGLTAGRNLKAGGRSFVIVEATDRIGGRGNTDSTTFSAPIDLGGAWIHDVKTNPLTPIILGSGFATQLTDVDASHHLFFSHHFASPEVQGRFQRIAEAFEESLAKAEGHDDAASNHLPADEPEGGPALPGGRRVSRLSRSCASWSI
jgi:monoamine oxidase